MTGVYKITSPSGKVYIGSAKNIKARIGHYILLDCKGQRKLYFSIKKHGWDKHKFEVLDTCAECDLFKKERYYCELFNVLGPNGLNLSIPGYDEVPGVLSAESRKLRSERQKGTGNHFYGKIHSQESRAKISKSNSVKSGETILKMRLAQLGKKASESTRLKMGAKQFGRKHSAETKEKMRLSSKKIKWVLNLETGIFYLGVREAATVVGIREKTLRGQLNGKNTNRTNFVYAA